MALLNTGDYFGKSTARKKGKRDGDRWAETKQKEWDKNKKKAQDRRGNGKKERAWRVIDNLSRKIVNYSLISVSPKGKFVISVVFLPSQIELIDFRMFVTKRDDLSRRSSPFSQISRIKICISLSGQMKTRHRCHCCFCSSNDSVCILHHQKIVTFLCHHMHTYDYVCCHMVSPKVEGCSVC